MKKQSLLSAILVSILVVSNLTPAFSAMAAETTEAVPEMEENSEILEAGEAEEPEEELPVNETDEPEEVAATDETDEPEDVSALDVTDEPEEMPAANDTDEPEEMPTTDDTDELREVPATAETDKQEEVPAPGTDIETEEGRSPAQEVQDVLYYWGINKDGELRISSKELPQEYIGGAVLPDSRIRNPWVDEGEDISSIVVGGEGDIVVVDNVRGLFGGMMEMEITPYPFYPNVISIDLTYLDTSNVTDMSGMFSYCPNLTDLTLGDMDTSNVENMSEMFFGCSSLTSLDVSSFNTSSVKSMSFMFARCRALETLDLSSFDTSNVRGTAYMFYRCSNLKTLDLSSFDVSNVDSMQYMFSDCSALTSLDISGWNASKVKNVYYLFNNCSSLTDLDTAVFTSYDITDTQYMFSNCQKLRTLDLSSFHTSNVTNMKEMFSYCSNLIALDLSSFDTSNVTDMEGMFSYCSRLPSLDLGHFDTSSVVNMRRMFYECRGLTSLDVSNFDTSKTTNMRAMFYYCCTLPELDVTNFDTSNVTDFAYMFACLHVLPRIDLSSFDMAKGTSVDGFFTGCKVLSGIISPVSVPRYYPVKLTKTFRDIADGTEYKTLPAGNLTLEPIRVTGIILNRPTLTLSMGGSAQLKPIVTPSSAPDKEVIWSTSDKLVASVTSDGIVKATGGGRAVITATTKEGGLKATCTVTVNNLPAPILKSAACVYGGVRITWDKVNGARMYRVYRKEPGGKWQTIAHTPGTYSTDVTAVSGKTYIYTARCLSRDESFSVSPYDANGLRITYIETPEIISGTSVLGGIQLKWNKPNGAVRFRVYRRNQSGAWAWLADTTGTTYTDKTTASGYAYTYTVRCMEADGKSYASSFNHEGTTVLYIAAPELVSAVKVTGGVKVTWKKPAGAVNFRVYRKSGTESWEILADTTSLTYTDQSVRSGTTYTYTVRCIRSDGKKSVSMYDYNGKTVKY